MSSRVAVFVVLIFACNPDDSMSGDAGSSGGESETGAEQACQYCGEEFLAVREVHCGDATSAYTMCASCCYSAAHEMACLSACEMGDCTAACASVEANAQRHESCLDSCMSSTCPVACSQAAVDAACEQACTEFLGCAAPGNTCEQTEACIATACAAGA